MRNSFADRPIVLPDGARLHVRPIQGEDKLRLQACVARCSPRTIFLRTNMVRPASLSDKEADYLTHVDYHSSMALVALAGAEPDEQIVAVARYAAGEAPGTAEAAVMVEDAYQQRGLGCQLLLRLVAHAQEQGFSSIIANISAENRAVQAAIRRTGLPAEYHYVGCGEYQVTVSLAPGTDTNAFPARAAGTVGRSLERHLGIAARLALLLRQS